MKAITITLERPLSQFVERQSQDRKVTPQQALMKLISAGFDALLHTSYQRYRQGEISFGRLAEDLGITTWELSHLLEERGLIAHNLPA